MKGKREMWKKVISGLFRYSSELDDEQKDPLDMAKEEYSSALEQLRAARVNFNNANDEYVEIANQELDVALGKYNAALKKVKILTNRPINTGAVLICDGGASAVRAIGDGR